MSAGQQDPSTSRNMDPLDILIESLADHRKYHSGLVSELNSLLSLTGPLPQHSQQGRGQERHEPSFQTRHQPAAGVHSGMTRSTSTSATAFRSSKQVKRLVNQSMSTLARWSKVLNAPQMADMIPRSADCATTTSGAPSHATTASALDPSVQKQPGQSKVAAGSRSGSGTAVKDNITRTMATKGPISSISPDDISSRRKVGAMKGAKKVVETGATVRTARNIKSTLSVPKGAAMTNTITTTNTSATATVTASSRPGSTQLATSKQTRASARGMVADSKSGTITSTTTLSTTSSTSVVSGSAECIYDTDQPTYAHIAVLVDVSFTGVSALERMGTEDSSVLALFEIEKARSNLITKIVELGMKKRALLELGILRERLLEGATLIWGTDGMEQAQPMEGVRRTYKAPEPEAGGSGSSTDCLKETYRHLFTFPFPGGMSSVQTPVSIPTASVATPTQTISNGAQDPVQTFVLLVLALQNNALLHEMMTQNDSAYDWCMRLAKIQQSAAQRPLDAIFRLMFIAAGKAVESCPTRGQMHAFQLRMLGMRYFVAYKVCSQSKDAIMWEKILRCGAEFDKMTRESRSMEDTTLILEAYKDIYECVQDSTEIDRTHPCFLAWCDHFAHLARSVSRSEVVFFAQLIRSKDHDRVQDQDQDQEMKVAEEAELAPAISPPAPKELPGANSIPPLVSMNTPPILRQGSSTLSSISVSSDQILSSLDEAVKVLRKFEESLQSWLSGTMPVREMETCANKTRDTLQVLESSLGECLSDSLSKATLQNVARIFRSMDTLRSTGSKVMDRCEKEQAAQRSKAGQEVSPTAERQERLLDWTRTVIEVLSDITEGLWRQSGADYKAWHHAEPKSCPSPTKLSCARVDAILFLFRLLGQHLPLSGLITPSFKPILSYLESAWIMSRDMNDQESLPWLSNAFYNHGGTLFKSGRQTEAIQPLERAVQCYELWLSCQPPSPRPTNSDTAAEVKDSAAVMEAKVTLANRFEVLGVCFLAVNNLVRAKACFESGLCALPLQEIEKLGTVSLGCMKASSLPAAKLLNRRTRTLLMQDEGRFYSVMTSVPEFERRMSSPGVQAHIRGIVQEYECGLLTVLSVKTNQIQIRRREQIDILRHLMLKVYRGGRAMTNPVRRARVLVQLAVLYQGSSEKSLQQEALHLVEEAVEILKDQDLKLDKNLEMVRNHHLAMAYTWLGVLDHHYRDTRYGSTTPKSKPFQIALQLWEMALANIECFTTVDDAQLPGHRVNVERALQQLAEPTLLFNHLQMLADCVGMIDYRLMQVQIYLIMLRLCNGVLPVDKDSCADAVRIYSRIAQAYMELGYSGKARMALQHGKYILQEMSESLEGDVHATWLLAHSMYLSSVGQRQQGIKAFNEARIRSSSQPNPSRLLTADPSVGCLSRRVEAKVYQTMVLAEASLARSHLLYYEGNLSESISDAMRAVRQLSRIVATLSSALKEAEKDSTIVRKPVLKNPFLDDEEEQDDKALPLGSEAKEKSKKPSGGDHALRKGLEVLATQRYQWSIVRLLIGAFHHLSKLYLAQGCAREAEYFLDEGKLITENAKATKSMERFLLDQAELSLRKHEFEYSRQIFRDLLIEQDDETDSATFGIHNMTTDIPSVALTLEIQDARGKLLYGDFCSAMADRDRSLAAYMQTNAVLTHLMDKDVISDLEQLVIHEPQTPREKNLIQTCPPRRLHSWVMSSATSSTVALKKQGTFDQAQFECVALGGIKSAMGYRSGLILSWMGRREEAVDLIENSRAEDPLCFTAGEYHTVQAKLLMLDLHESMSKHLMYAMLPDSAMSVGLFQKSKVMAVARPPESFLNWTEMKQLFTDVVSSMSASVSASPSVRATRGSRNSLGRRQAHPSLSSPIRRAATSRLQATESHDQARLLVQQYLSTVSAARQHLLLAYRHSIGAGAPHVITDICARQAYLVMLEMCFRGEDGAQQGYGNDHVMSQSLTKEMASRTACHLEMAKAIAQRREMHGLIKQKLNPALPQEDQSWPRDIHLKDSPMQEVSRQNDPAQPLSAQLMTRRGMSQKRIQQELRFGGLERPKPLNLGVANVEPSKGDVHMASTSDMMGEETAEDLEDEMDEDWPKSKREQQEYLDRQNRAMTSTTYGNDRGFLETLDALYERDGLNAHPENFQRDFIDIVPPNWTVVSMSMDVPMGALYVTRMRAHSTPLVVRLPLNRSGLREDAINGRGPHGTENIESGGILTYQEAVDELKDILRTSHETLNVTSTLNPTSSSTGPGTPALVLSREDKVEWWQRRQWLDNRLRNLLATMEDHWLCGLKGLIQSHNTTSREEHLLGFKTTLEWIISQAADSISSGGGSLARGNSKSSSGPGGAPRNRRPSAVQLEINIDLCRVILHLGDSPSEEELRDLIYFLLDAHLYRPVSGASHTFLPSGTFTTTTAAGSEPAPASISTSYIEYSDIQIEVISRQIEEALGCYWRAETIAENNGYDEGAHVILILDKHLQMFPWESCPVLRDEAVSRVPSICFLRDRILHQQWKMKQRHPCPQPNQKQSRSEVVHVQERGSRAETGPWEDLEVDPRRGFYVLNPGSDLKNTEEEFKDYVTRQRGWSGIINRPPIELELVQGLSKSELYIYFGHSGGEQYIKSQQIRQLGSCAVSLLLGCSSGRLAGSGDFDPTGNVMHYLLAGCPTIVANLWDVTDKDLDRFSQEMLTLWGLDQNCGPAESDEESVAQPKQLHLARQPLVRRTSRGGEAALGGPARALQSIDEEKRLNFEMEGKKDKEGEVKDRGAPGRLSIVQAVAQAREVCRMKFLVGAATVVYGIPCFLKDVSL